jgi:LexA-binding, inner membrane-associated putative hydrolase
MMGSTHRALAVTAATGVSIAANAEPDAAMFIIGAAWTTARLPDRMEQVFHAKHRTWTHWLLVAILSALTLAAVIFAAGYGLAALAEGRMCNGTDASAQGGCDFAATLAQASAGIAVLVGIGALCGTISHVLSDACTDGGSSGVPLLGPFYRQGIWLMPQGLRCLVNPVQRDRHGNPVKDRNGNEQREMSGGERCWQTGAWLATGLIVFLHYAPQLRGVAA